MTTTSTYLVDGMTCAHCVTAVTSELMALGSVREVVVDLRPEAVGAVTVHSAVPLDRTVVAAAIDEAGYALVDIGAAEDPATST